jgi:hypothetical protein
MTKDNKKLNFTIVLESFLKTLAFEEGLEIDLYYSGYYRI